MSTDDENYEDFVKRYHAEQEASAGSKRPDKRAWLGTWQYTAVTMFVVCVIVIWSAILAAYERNGGDVGRPVETIAPIKPNPWSKG